MSVPSWYPPAAVALVSAVCAVLLALAGCGEGNAGQVCTEPNAADCPSDSGGELYPKAGVFAGFGYGLNAGLPEEAGE